jgi:hypothetical protein
MDARLCSTKEKPRTWGVDGRDLACRLLGVGRYAAALAFLRRANARRPPHARSRPGNLVSADTVVETAHMVSVAASAAITAFDVMVV